LAADFRFDLAGTALQIQSISASINPRDHFNDFTSVQLRELLLLEQEPALRELALLLEPQEPEPLELGPQVPLACRVLLG
jgi:hypothetical protein